ncbi:MAG: hypothetical protein AAB653_03555 [Patescibacteria group bacterium]
MNTITISQKMLNGDDLIIVPHREYEGFLNLEKTIKRSSKNY